MTERNLHVVHLLIRQNLPGDQVGFLVYPHEHWKDETGGPYLALPAKKTVGEPLAEFLQGTPLDAYIDQIARDNLQIPADAYALEQELEAVEVGHRSPTHMDDHGQALLTRYTVYPIDLWVAPDEREPLRRRVQGAWLGCEEALANPRLSPTARPLFATLRRRQEDSLGKTPENNTDSGAQVQAIRRLRSAVPDRPSMDGLARKWLAHNLRGVRHLDKKTLDDILESGSRAFNLRVADPYLPYQMQGVGFTWSFFTEKDTQDCHVHGAPVVEIYGVLSGRLEVWWKPYYERGTSAWSRRFLEAGDWLEVDSLQCHIVKWLGAGRGVVFKAGPGPLAAVGKLGLTGKTPCTDCACMKPTRVREMEPGPTPTLEPSRAGFQAELAKTNAVTERRALDHD
jgi:hypothetical protein